MSAIPSQLSSIQAPTEHKPARQSRSLVPSTAVVTAVVTFIALLNAIGLLLVLRRFVGALSDELPRDAMLLTALVATAIVAAIRIAWRHVFPLRPLGQGNSNFLGNDWDAIVGYGSSLALVLFAVGCCYPAYHTSDWLIWLPPLVADQFWRQTFLDAGSPANSLALASLEMDEEAAATLAFPAERFDIASAPAAASPRTQGDSTEEVVQLLFRVRTDEGHEVVYGTVRADFVAGQRTAVVHIGFCPPLSHLPEIEAEPLPGSTARVKVAQALAHGTRLEVRLPAPAEEDRHILIDMAATPAFPLEKKHA